MTRNTMRISEIVYTPFIARRWIYFLSTAIGLLLRPSLAGRVPDPGPISATTSTDFYGYDGSWSAVRVRTGRPEQWLWLLPSTLSQEIHVVGPAGCDGTVTCQTKRGGLFSANESYSFQPKGFYDLNFDSQLDASGIGYYGIDNIAFEDTVTSVPGQVVAVINSTDQWLGSLGLGAQQTRFNGTENYLPLISSLVENQSLIPSHSYGYTAGAAYRLKGVPASLTFGGVDLNRFVPNNVTFSLSSDYAPVVAINTISVSSSPYTGESLPANWSSNPETLLDASQANLFTIDSSTPFLWLPEKVCDSFATALNLTYDDKLQLYIFSGGNYSSPDTLAAWNLTFTFALSNLPNSPNVIELTLPYDAFNLQLSYPFPNLDANFTSAATSYFPLRRAANSSQYTIGRAFLQETYLAVDYERNYFSLSQAVFNADSNTGTWLSPISRPPDSTWPGPDVGTKTNAGLSTGAKAGIGVGAAIGASAATVLIWMLCLRKKTTKDAASGGKNKSWGLLGRLHRSPDSKTSVSELLGDKRHPTEAPADSSVTRFELPGDTPSEMPAAPVSPSFFASGQAGDQRGSTTMRNDPRHPAELEHRNSTCKGGDIAASERSASPVPPYSPPMITNDNNNNGVSSSVSPYSFTNSRGGGTLSSGEQGISPVGAGSGGYCQTSSNGNRSTPSPVSPQADPGSQQQLSQESHTIPSRSESLIVPQLHGRPPTRSPSTGSRFQEEGLDTLGEEPKAIVPEQPSRGHRFSWEQ